MISAFNQIKKGNLKPEKTKEDKGWISETVTAHQQLNCFQDFFYIDITEKWEFQKGVKKGYECHSGKISWMLNKWWWRLSQLETGQFSTTEWRTTAIAMTSAWK